MKAGMKVWRILSLVLVGLVSPCVRAQSFNIDANNEFATPPLGGGVPAPSFGGAANQTGQWDFFPVQGLHNRLLRDVAGNLTA
jgi:hypothetical protein